ncbi:MAG: hypothetical protein SFX73_14455 [Kofleriaceae bacterium]|nr:hypothetical protein [Kofleriaceae bacterium]
MMRLLLALLVAACGGSPLRPIPTTAAPAPSVPAPVQAHGAAPRAASKAPPSLLETFDQGDLDRITITEVDVDTYPGCAPETGPTWIVSAIDARNDGATCIGDGNADPTCVLYAGTTPEHVARVMCTERARATRVDVPAWAPRVIAALRTSSEAVPWHIEPIQDSVRPAIAVLVDTNMYIAIRTNAGWQRTTDAVEQMTKLTAHRLVDTSSLTGAPSFGVVTSSYSGGSQSGTETTSFTVLTPTPTGLALAGTIQLGQFTWLLEATERRKYPKAAGDMEARPHVDVQLTPRIDGDALVLDLARAKITKELAGTCRHSPEGDDLNAPCILVDRKAAAGRYKLVNRDFQRVR